MLQHFSECIKQAKSLRHQAVQINIFTAVLYSLKVTVVITVFFSSCCPCRQEWGWPWLLSSFLHLFFPLVTFLSLSSLSTVSNSLSFAVVFHSPPTFSRSLLTQTSHHILVLPCLLFPSTFLASAFNANFSSPFLSTSPAHFSLLLTSFFLKLSFIPTFTLGLSSLLFQYSGKNDLG